MCDPHFFLDLFLLFFFGALVFLVDEPALDIAHALLEGAYMGYGPAFEFFKAFGDSQQRS